MDHYSVVQKLDRGKNAAFEGNSKQILDWLKNQADVKQYEVYSHINSKYYSVAEFVKKINDFVPKFYEMDPETEDLLPSGKHLANGMVVLLAEPDRRHSISGETQDWILDRLRGDNRWCRVSHLTIKGSTTVSFVGTYNDGTKRLREFSIDAPWLVKLDSVGETAQRYLFVLEQVHRAMRVSASAGETNKDTDLVAEDVAKKILGVL